MAEVKRIQTKRGEFIQTDRAAISKNPLSQSIRVRNPEWLFCSGQLGIDPVSGQRVSGGAGPETRQVMENLKAVLEAGGASMDTVVKTTVFVTHLSPEEAKAVNEEYERYFTFPFPARSLVEVAGLNRDCKVEIECIALVHELTDPLASTAIEK